jgi:ribosomal protein S18 acetylase RimI-like enzyme
MGTIDYERIDIQKIDLIKELWEALRDHHKNETDYFKQRFENLTFETRKKAILEKAENGKLIIDIVKINAGKIIGYCVSSIDEKQNGEIDSILVDEQFRGMKIGEELVVRALNWFDENKVETRRIVVAQGNERAFKFYEKFGFYHLFSTLQQKMKSIILLVTVFFNFQSYALAQETKVEVFEDKYLCLSQNNKEFYLINADSSENKKTFQVNEQVRLYFLVFSWKYNIDPSVEIVYSPTHSEKAHAGHSHRTPFSPMYVPIKVANRWPLGIKLCFKSSQDEFYLPFENITKKALSLKPLLDKFGFIDWEALPCMKD